MELPYSDVFEHWLSNAILNQSIEEIELNGSANQHDLYALTAFRKVLPVLVEKVILYYKFTYRLINSRTIFIC